jgi:hypothetical protein
MAGENSSKWCCYSGEMSGLNRDQERPVIDALVALPEMPTIDSLKAVGVRTIQDLLGCSIERAQAILTDLREANRIEAAITPRGGSLDQRERMPVGRLRWVCPTTDV